MVTFIHDHVFLKNMDQIYTSGSLNREVMERYIDSFGSIRMVTRSKDVKSVKIGLESSNIKNTEFIHVPNYKTIKKSINYFKARKIIKKEVKNAEYIILRTSSFANIASRYAKKYKKPYLVEVVGCAWDATWNYNLLGKLMAPVSYILQRKTVRAADYAVYVTENFLQNRYPANGEVTNCSNVALSEFNESTLQKRLEKIEKLSSDKKIIIGTTAAVDVRYKGQQYIIEALGKLKAKGVTRFEYQLIGGGDQEYLKMIAEKYNVSDYVRFLGSKPHKEVFEWLDSIDIYVQPSKQEGLPRALIEAMSRGLPAFGARTAGIPELLEEGFIFSNKMNINEICNLLQSFDKDVMRVQAERNYKESQKYDRTVIEKRRKKFFQEFKKLNNKLRNSN